MTSSGGGSTYAALAYSPHGVPPLAGIVDLVVVEVEALAQLVDPTGFVCDLGHHVDRHPTDREWWGGRSACPG